MRLLPPGEGLSVFGSVRRELGWGGSREDAAFRGEEMMQGGERRLLERVVWGDPVGGSGSTGSGSNGPGSVDGGKEFEGYEAVLGAGDGLFIPKGWWHSIKGVGEGVTASVCFFSSLAFEVVMHFLTRIRSIGGSGRDIFDLNISINIIS